MTDKQKQLILKHKSLAQIVAGRMYKVLGYQMEYDDVLQYAYLGLIDAINKFKPDTNVPFEAYAPHRIRGYILDEARRVDLASRDLRAKIRAKLHEDIRFCSYDDSCIAVPCRFSASKLDLESAINTLSTIEREIIYYHYVKGFPLNEICSKVERCYLTVTRAHKRALNKLRESVS